MKHACTALASFSMACLVSCFTAATPPEIHETPVFQFAVEALDVNEAQGVCTLQVELAKAIGEPASVHLGISSSSTARKGIDFDCDTGKIDFAPFEVRKWVSVKLLRDSLPGNDRRADFELTRPSDNAVMGWNWTCGVTIHDANGLAGTLTPAEIATITGRVSTLRGLSFVRPVKVGYFTRTQYRQSVQIRVNEDISGLEDTCLSSELYQLCLTDSPQVSAREVLTDYESYT